ncbi:MAG: cyanophycinase [Chitinophagales bacterium]|nr:cyanophycinase [Chitinophagales bacterium]
MKTTLQFKIILFFITTIHFYSCTSVPEKIKTAPDKRGILFIIGGGERDDTLMQQMVDLSGWKKGETIAIIPLTSEYDDSAYMWTNDQLQKLTGQAAINIDSASINNQIRIDSLSKAKIIFICGGDQNRFMRLTINTGIIEAIKTAYNNGATVGGTSAGASLMSEMMITGNQLLDTAYKATFDKIRSANVELKPGIGLLDSIIIDQHFITRSRFNRMLSAIMDHPNYQCIGIDESTALIVQGDSATVVGVSEVVVFSNPKNIHNSDHNLIGADEIDIAIHLPGDKFKIKN